MKLVLFCYGLKKFLFLQQEFWACAKKIAIFDGYEKNHLNLPITTKRLIKKIVCQNLQVFLYPRLKIIPGGINNTIQILP